MRYLKSILLVAAMLPCLGGMAQQREVKVDITVSTVPGDNLSGQTLTVTQTDYSVGYGTLTLDAAGHCSLMVYAGNHRVDISRPGFEPLSQTFTAVSGEPLELSLQLSELTRKPYALKAEVDHNPVDGRDDILLSWNAETPAFFDDFESYEAFAISFGDWTGFDKDGQQAAPLVGNYPNRGVLQYAQIINPMTVVPTWWYDYPVLRPYSGQQYAGFARTASGAANDDWLITPEITVGVNNVLSFMAKAADQYDERFMVYVTTVTGSPTTGDFVRLDKGNFESVDYRSWREFSYDLSEYEGQKVKLAIRYIGDAARFGSFMLMVDDVYVGQNTAGAVAAAKARRVQRSPENANEHFEVYLDGLLQGTTEGYSYRLGDVQAGNHTIGVQAVYLNSRSETAELEVATGMDNYARLTVAVTAESKLSPEGTEVTLLSHDTAREYSLTVAGGKAEWLSLPAGVYDINVGEGAYQAYQTTIELTADMDHAVVLRDNMITPYNITAVAGEDGSCRLRWNQTSVFSDSFEAYDDFATGRFGEWVSIDNDGQPVYPIGLGSTSNIVSFPGSGSQTNPAPVAPMVFNPWNTVPAMMPADPAIAAPTGDKTVIFFSAQMAQNDKWLISPVIYIREGFELTFLAKAYSIYPERFEICVSDGSTAPGDFVTIASIDELPSTAWGQYSLELDEYEGMEIRLALRYLSYDAFLAQVDDFTVGPADGVGEQVDYGNVLHYSVYVDGILVGEPETAEFTLAPLGEGDHSVDIYAEYLKGRSGAGHITIAGQSGLHAVKVDQPECEAEYFDLTGRQVARPAAGGIYLRRTADRVDKIRF